MRRLKLFSVSANLIAQMLTTDNRIPQDGISYYQITEGLPEGAEIVDYRWDFALAMIHVLVSHESFDELAEGVDAWQQQSHAISITTYYRSDAD